MTSCQGVAYTLCTHGQIHIHDVELQLHLTFTTSTKVSDANPGNLAFVTDVTGTVQIYCYSNTLSRYLCRDGLKSFEFGLLYLDLGTVPILFVFFF